MRAPPCDANATRNGSLKEGWECGWVELVLHHSLCTCISWRCSSACSSYCIGVCGGVCVCRTELSTMHFAKHPTWRRAKFVYDAVRVAIKRMWDPTHTRRNFFPVRCNSGALTRNAHTHTPTTHRDTRSPKRHIVIVFRESLTRAHRHRQRRRRRYSARCGWCAPTRRAQDYWSCTSIRTHTPTQLQQPRGTARAFLHNAILARGGGWFGGGTVENNCDTEFGFGAAGETIICEWLCAG